MKFFSTLLVLLACVPLAGQTLHKVMVEPCGSDEPRSEIISFVNGPTPTNVGTISIHSLNTMAGTQPNVTQSWSGPGTDTGGDPLATCPNSNVTCLNWLDINTPAEAIVINDLINQLNTQAGPCTPTLFVAPTGPNYGIIPAGAQVIFFLGAGGNQSGTLLPGFDMLGTNLDFTSYCNGPAIYAVFGQQPGGNTLFGLLANGGNRAMRIQINGSTVDSLYIPNNPGGILPEVSDSSGVISYGGPCTPADLFGLAPLDASSFSQASILEDNDADPGFSIYPNPTNGILHVHLPIDGPQTVRQKIYSIDGKSTELRTLTISEGNQFDIHVESLPPALYSLELMTDHGVYRTTFLRH